MSGRVIDLDFHLLDRQIVASDGVLAGKVDDVEITFPDDGGPPFVSGLYSGMGALARRTMPDLGRGIEWAASRLMKREPPNSISFGIVKRLGNDVEVTVSGAELASTVVERWFSRHVISRIPGARHATE